MISAKDFARTAREVYEHHTVQYRKGGSSLDGMDSAGFITYCLRKHGVKASYKGTNDLFRSACTQLIPLKEAIRNEKNVPGVILLHIDENGNEPQEYKADGKGDCDFCIIAIDSTTALYPSQLKGALISTRIEPVKGKANYIAHLKHVNYDNSSITDSDRPSESVNSSSKGGVTTVGLNLRKRASLSAEVIIEIPEGKQVEILEHGSEWCKVKYTVRSGLYHIGWCASQYLTI